MTNIPGTRLFGRKTAVKDCGPYSQVFSPAMGTTEVYNKVGKPIVDGVLDGFNGTIFAYGQTGSGKTYSLLGDHEHPGFIFLACVS